MSTVLVYDNVSDLAGSQTADDEVTLTWTAAEPLYPLVNGGAELGDMTGWTSTLGAWTVAVQGEGGQFNNPKEGTHVFFGGLNVNISRSHQRISPLCLGLTIADIAAGKDVTLKYWMGSSDATSPEQLRLSKYFYDADGVLISSVIPSYAPLPGPAATGQIRWFSTESVDVIAIPAGTAFIDIEMDGDRRNGTTNNCHFDDIRVEFEDAQPLPYIPGYAIYQDGILVATAPANATEYTISGLSPGSYEFKIVAYDGTNFLSGDSNEVEVSVTVDPAEDVINDIYLFNDEEIFTGYLGGKLRGKTVACPGRNANTARKCGG